MATGHPSQTRPAGFCVGAGHVVMYGNPAFVARFGERCLGMPAREVMVDLPEAGFEVFDAVYSGGRALARWVTIDGEEWRVVARPRQDPDTGMTYGVAFHLRARSDAVDAPPDPERRRPPT